MYRQILSILAVSVLAGCTQTHDRGPPPAPNLTAPVAYELSSWGTLLTRWQVNPDGSGEIWRGPGPGNAPAEIRKYRMRLDPAGMAMFSAEVESLRMLTRAPLACRRTITDLPYGHVTWGGADDAQRQEWRFDTGCHAPEVDRAMQQIKRADAAIELKAKVEPRPYAVEAVR